jgi:KipI family sensor histidine kinase inhibitor
VSALADWAAPHIRYVGDSALLLDVGAAAGIAERGFPSTRLGADPSTPLGTGNAEMNRSAVSIASAVRAAAVRGVRDVQATFRSVVVHFDPLQTDVGAVVDALQRVEGRSAEDVSAAGRTIEIPVTYGGEEGPDLAAVAAWAGCSEADVVARHAGRTYRVFMLGFLPGFPYLGEVDASIAMPRLATPRARVAPGSVGIAGAQTGVYPQASPGGWQIIGRTAMRMFDATREQPALLAAGDAVRFVAAPVGRALSGSPGEPEGFAPRTDQARRHVTVLRPGLFTTIQDLGRWGHQASGVPVSGAMDTVSHRLANAAVGNAPDAATLEVTVAGPELRFDQETTIAIGGADLSASLDGREIRPGAGVACGGGSILRFGPRRAGARAYVAFDGAIATDPVLGSRATHALTRLGGLAGEGLPLHAGDRVPLGEPAHVGRTFTVRQANREGSPDVPPTLRVLPGPQLEQLPSETLERLLATTFTVSAQSDRMGYRLVSEVALPRGGGGDMLSDATFAGAVQVPPSGEPILLMADRQTTGGYPQAAIVITADLSRAGQLAPGDTLRFELCTRAQAVSALIACEGHLLAAR